MALQNSSDTILCMFSGGIDSAGVLHQFLTHPEYGSCNIIFHHIHIINREHRAKAESMAVKTILEFYHRQNTKTFLYTESIFNTSGFAPLKSRRFPFDMDICAFFAGNLCAAQKNIRNVALGRTKTDVGSADQSFTMRMDRAQKIFKSVLSMENIQPHPKYIFPVLEFTKREIWNFLPEYVRTNAWWCRRPVYENSETVRACGKCETCRTVREFV